jgi:8-oxo-dGTP pyrophosphatase MutT (NUDIX family)
MHHLLTDAPALAAHIIRVLHEKTGHAALFPERISLSPTASAVLVLLGRETCGQGSGPEPCLIFNKRSLEVKQPGDLCFPGGRISPGLDVYLSKALRLPFSPLTRWPYWEGWCRTRPMEAKRLVFLFAASLREGFEEMRLNPFRVRFLGPLPRQRLTMFDRVIYPMVGAIGRQRRFFPNWEVEKIVYIPLKDLLDGDGYGCYRVRMGYQDETASPAEGHHIRTPIIQDFPCFVHDSLEGREILWGATYRITTLFLELIFGFVPPPLTTLPIIEGALNTAYLTGIIRSRSG